MEKQNTDEQVMYAYWFHNMKLAGNKKMWEISERIGSPGQIYDCDPQRLGQILTDKQLKYLENSKSMWDLEKEWEKLEEKKIRFLPYFHRDYPEYLREIPDPPWGIYLKGKLPDKRAPRAAIVGARQCSEYGRNMAVRLGRILGENGIPVISGMARGIDGISQRETLEAGGESLAVLGCGVDICYPLENRDLYNRLEIQGGILSEYPPGTQPIARNFPPRNRIISGLCDVLIVVEAKEKSGTLITVDMALEQGKEVLALPGRMTDALSRGCNNLIRQGAGILTSPEDVFQFLPGSKEKNAKHSLIDETDTDAAIRTEEERELYRVLDYMPKSLERIWSEYNRDNISMQRLMQMLLELYMRGAVGQAGGSYYKK